MAVTGRLIDDATGRPVSGAIIDFVRTGGVQLETDSVRVTTNGEGLFTIEMESTSSGEVVGDIVVQPPNAAGYRAPNMHFPTSNRRGEAFVLPAWSTVLRLPDLAMVYRRGFPREPLGGVDIEFQQTGGARVSGLTNGVYRETTNSVGWISLFGSAVQPLEAGDVIGDLTINLPAPLGTIHRDVRIPVKTTYRPAAELRTFGAGPNLDYHIAVSSRGTGALVPGVRVEFQRTGGAAVVPETWTALTDGNGRVAFPMRALEFGVVRGNVKVVPPAPWKEYELTALDFPVFDDDDAVLFRVLGVGPGLPYYAVIRNNGAPLKGVQVEFRRVSGIQVNPSAFTSVTNDTGVVFTSAAPVTEGDLVVDVTVRPPAPLAGFVVRGVQLVALESDPPGGRLLIGDWDLASPPAGSSKLP